MKPFSETHPSLAKYVSTCECGAVGAPRHPEDDIVFVPTVQRLTVDKAVLRAEINIVREMIEVHKDQLGNVPLLVEFLEDMEEALGLDKYGDA